MKLTINIYILFGIFTIGAHSTKSIDAECDPISNTDFGRRFCFFRHIRAEQPTANITIKLNPIADEKRELIFDNCTLYTMPLRIFENFPNIKTIYTWNTHLKALTKEIFAQAEQLTLLDLSKNQIESLTANTFSLALNLKHLELSQNVIQSIDVDTFSGLQRLQVLHLNHNKVELIPANVFSELHDLKTVRLDHNQIKTIPMELFAANGQLRNIFLNDNSIEWMMGEQSFRHLSHVVDFDLHNNPILNMRCCVINAQSIDIRNTNARCCYIGTRTKRILANDNRISFIEISGDGTATVAHSLQHIDLANNKLNEIKNLTHFSDLMYMDVSNNRFIDIGLNSFASMHGLEVLNLRNSGLHNIHFGSFSHKSHLKELDISYNELRTIDFRMFMSMANLKTLLMEGNNITDINMTEIRKIFPALTKIGIARNNWTCDNLASIIKYLESNSISLNSVGVIENTENIKGIPCTNDASDLNSDEAVENENSSTMIKSSFETVKNSHRYAEQLNLDSSQPIDLSDKCHNSPSNYDTMNAMVRLIELKYETQDTAAAIQSIAKKLDNLLDQIQRDANKHNNDYYFSTN